jgi:hypothetical protein
MLILLAAHGHSFGLFSVCFFQRIMLPLQSWTELWHNSLQQQWCCSVSVSKCACSSLFWCMYVYIYMRTIRIITWVGLPYFRTCAQTWRAWRVNLSTRARTRTGPSTRTHTSVHSYASKFLHSYANTILQVRWVVRTSITTFICTRTPHVHFLLEVLKNIIYET